jgi:hypothetical protein
MRCTFGDCDARATWTGTVDGVGTARCDRHRPDGDTDNELHWHTGMAIALTAAVLVGVAALVVTALQGT